MEKRSPLFSAFSPLLVLALGAALVATACVKAEPGGTGPTCGSGQTTCGQQCVNTATDVANCGACNHACSSGQTCQNGSCTCQSGMLCGGVCVNSDATHCGNCTTTCTSGMVCNNNACSSSCSGGTTMCGTACVVTNGSDVLNCGGCNVMCAAGQVCNGGTCACSGSLTACGTSCVDTTSSAQNCGSCGHGCTSSQHCTNSACVDNGGTAGTSGGSAGTSGGSAGTSGGSAGTNGGTAGTNGGTAGHAGTSGGTAGTSGGSAGTNGGTAGTGVTPAGWWTSGSWHGCPWTGVDTLNVGSMSTPKDFVTKSDSFGTPYCVSGTVGPDPGYNGTALLGFNISETPMTSTQCAYKAPDGTAIGPASIALTGNGIALSFSKTVGSVLRIQIQDEMGGLTNGGDTHRWCYTVTDVQGPIFAPFNRFNTKCWDQSGSMFNPNSNHIDAIVFNVPGNTIPTPFAYCIAGFATGNDVSAAPAYNPSPWPTVAGTIGGPGSTDLDFQRVKVAAPMKGGAQYIVQNNNWGTPSSTDQTINYKDNSFTIQSTTGNVTGAGVPASFPSIYVGGNGDTQAANDPPKGSYTTHPGDGLPKAINSIGTAMTTAAYNKSGGDYNATYDIWLAAPPAPTSQYSDALDGFVMVWLYKPSGRSPIGSMKTTKTINGDSYNIWAGPRGSGTNPNRPVVSYVLATSTMNKTFDLKPILADAAANSGSYGVTAIQPSWLVTDIFFGFEIWTGSAASGLGVTNFTVNVN
jgi:hypothetical protein